MDEFETLLLAHRNTVERFVYCKMPSKFDGDDVLQEIYLTALRNYDTLHDKSAFRSWIMRIARSKCSDFYRRRARQLAIPLDEIEEMPLSQTGFEEHDTRLDVRNTLNRLPEKEQQILYLFYLRGISQKDIASRLSIPVGTVKSRLSAAKKHFIKIYGKREENSMTKKQFSRTAPKYRIKKSDKPAFDVICEEVPGWCIVPRTGEKQRFAFYDDASDGSGAYLSGITEMECTRNAVIHGVDCVQISVTDTDENGKSEQREMFVRLTETHCMYIADMMVRDGVLHFASFMDEEWLERYEIGTNNCGRAIHQTVGNSVTIHEDGSLTISDEFMKSEGYELIGRYEITLNSVTYDTMAMISVMDGILVMQYLDKNGRTVLFRRFNRDDWQSSRRGYRWTEKLPESERLTVNGDTYVHWYDCAADFVME